MPEKNFNTGLFHNVFDRQLLFALIIITAFCFVFVIVNSHAGMKISAKNVSASTTKSETIKPLPKDSAMPLLPTLSVQSGISASMDNKSNLQTNVSGQNTSTGDAPNTINLQADTVNQDPDFLNITVPKKIDNTLNHTLHLIIK